MKHTISLVALLTAFPAFAESTRQLDAHKHGVGTLNIAVDGTAVVMELEAPGADIVGFEHAAENDVDKDAVDAAVALLSAPLDLFVMPEAAGCIVAEAHAELESEAMHSEHGEDNHADEGHDDHADEDHADESGHTEFHAEYALTCENPDALTEITFAYFNTFPNAKEVEVQLLTASGAQAYEVERDTPVLGLGR